jgi:hypothetical protein
MQAGNGGGGMMVKDYGIYWVNFNLPKNDGEMKLQVEAQDRNKAIVIAREKAKKMSSEWVFSSALCVR